MANAVTSLIGKLKKGVKDTADAYTTRVGANWQAIKGEFADAPAQADRIIQGGNVYKDTFGYKNPQTLGQKAANTGLGLLDNIGSASLRGVVNTGKGAYDLGRLGYGMATGTLAQQAPFKSREEYMNLAKQQTGDAFRFGGTVTPFRSVQALKTATPAIGLYSGLEGGLNVLNDKSGKSRGMKFAEGAVSGLERGVPMAGVGVVSNPLISKAMDKKFTTLGKLAIGVPANIAEGYAMNKSAGMDYTKEDAIIDALVPVGIETGKLGIDQVKSFIKKGLSDGRITQETAKQLDNYIMKNGRKYWAGKLNGQFATKEQLKAKTPYNTVKTYFTKQTITDVNTGKMKEVLKPIKDSIGNIASTWQNMDVYNKEGKLLGNTEQFRKFLADNPELAVFAPVGMPEVTTDENGKIQIKQGNYNLGQRALAFGALKGVKSEAGQKILKNAGENIKNIAGDAIQTLEKDAKYAFNINKNKLNIGEDGKKVLDQAVEQIRPILEGNKGKALTKNEIINSSKKASILENVVGRDETAAFTASLQATREKLAQGAKQGGLSADFLKDLEVVSSYAADTGRRLKSFDIGAGEKSLKEKVVKELLDLGTKADDLLEAGKNVDWNDSKQVTEFYRKFKPAQFLEYLDEFRYTNMLSSPQTQIVNTFSNALNTGVVAPIEKTLTGSFDWARSKLTGKEQEYFARQGIDYAKGYFGSLPNATKKALSILKGSSQITNPDVNMIPTTTNKIWGAYKLPLTALEASDQFFRELVKGGEKAALKTAGVVGDEADKIANSKADYRLFRQEFDPNGELGQNIVLQTFDKWNSTIARMRSLPGGKYLVPFLKTPTNILKQGLEYSPLGATTIIGSASPMEQLAKTAIGSTVFMGAYGLANSGLTTWDAPTGTKEKEEFYAAGLQPYSIKIGDKWYSYSKLGPLSFPIAMASALKWAEDNSTSDSQLTKIGQAFASTLGFFADQSYMQGIGDIIDAVRGDEYKLERSIANIPSQFIPYTSFQGWVARIVDPVYRKANTPLESVMAKTPGQSQKLEPYTTPLGEPSKRQFPLLNAVSPVRVTQENPMYKQYYDIKKEQRKETKMENNLRSTLKGEKKIEGTTISTSPSGINYGISKDKVIYLDADGSTKSISLDFKLDKPKTSGNELLDKELISDYKTSISRKKNDIVKLYELGIIDQQKASQMLGLLDIEYKGLSTKKSTKKINTPKMSFKKTSFKPASESEMPKLGIKFEKPKGIKISANTDKGKSGVLRLQKKVASI